MVIKSVELSLVCGVTSKIPAGTLPEFAFAGRSNVGKSTLINGLMNRKSLARVSAQPGKTQTINYYQINGEFFLVDLPGYGYARANVKPPGGLQTGHYRDQIRQDQTQPAPEAGRSPSQDTPGGEPCGHAKGRCSDQDHSLVRTDQRRQRRNLRGSGRISDRRGGTGKFMI